MNGRPRRWTHGPSFEEGGVRFRLWAPSQKRVSLALEGRSSRIPMEPRNGGFFDIFVEGIGAGSLYRFELSDGALVPDPASRFQPKDVHGPSETIDHDAYRWRARWPGLAWDDVVLYELHVGAFTPEGSFAGAARKLDHLVELGVTAIEIMPVADFRGRWGWGYDGVYPYAPDATYGRPEDFKSFVDAAHSRGVAVVLDVVYNHFGPEGNYLSSYAPNFFTARHRTPWGEAIDFDGPDARPVRDFMIENAEYWIDAFRLDGLRLDAVHSIKDDSRPDIVDELGARLRSRSGRAVHLLLENENNEPQRLVRYQRKPLLYAAQWNDDLHHVLHVAATHERSSYYGDYGDTKLLARALAEGFAYQGELSSHREAPRGGPSADLPPGAFVAFIQNHDQIGNRAFGERLSALASPAALRALASVYLLAPQTPMLFMGEEWAAAQPFPFFCDFDCDLAEAVRVGRRAEFALFPEFAESKQAAKIPDPLAESTFLSAKLDWSRIDIERLGFYRAALAARREHVRPLLPEIEHGGQSSILGEQAVRVVWRSGERRLVLDANLSDGGVAFPDASGVFWRCAETEVEFGPWSVRWSVGAA
ncbi:MAG TPA: malto-oligosyltrehalose trehalohydrolase [Roseiarcus sp.]|nr:malto-oligosyltrehalose trehalohydrolase [Roseiarcus sp.]